MSGPENRVSRIAGAIAPWLALLTILVGAASTARRDRGHGAAPRMCEGLPDYELLDERIPRDASVIYRPADGLDRTGERFFCARFALAPRLVSRPSWPRVTARIRSVAWTVDDDGRLEVNPPPGAP